MRNIVYIDGENLSYAIREASGLYRGWTVCLLGKRREANYNLQYHDSTNSVSQVFWA